MFLFIYILVGLTLGPSLLKIELPEIIFSFIGLVFSPWLNRNEKVLRGLMLSSKYFFAPIFFIGVGMKIHLQENFDLLQCLTILLLAVVTKMIGVCLRAWRSWLSSAL